MRKGRQGPVRSRLKLSAPFVLLAGALVATSCGQIDARNDSASIAVTNPATPAAVWAPSPTPRPSATSVPTPLPTATPTPGPSPTPPPTATPIPRIVSEHDYEVMAQAGPVAVVFPATSIERIGFHEAGHSGAQQMELVLSATEARAQIMTLESRGRKTGPQSAADVVVDPSVEIRSPVSGTVLHAGSYVLYCEHDDHLVIIEAEGEPGVQVKVFHMIDMLVGPGDLVEAGVTVISTGARLLPFESQVDEFTAEPSWPHVHVEVVDTSIPDERTGGGC